MTGYCSAEIDSSEIDSHVKLATETKDPDLACDLCPLNKGKPGDTFNVFFDYLQKMLEVIVANDCRHGIMHMAEHSGVQDLIERVKEIKCFKCCYCFRINCYLHFCSAKYVQSFDTTLHGKSESETHHSKVPEE